MQNLKSLEERFKKIKVCFYCVTKHQETKWLKTFIIYLAHYSMGQQFTLDSTALDSACAVTCQSARCLYFKRQLSVRCSNRRDGAVSTSSSNRLAKALSYGANGGSSLRKIKIRQAFLYKCFSNPSLFIFVNILVTKLNHMPEPGLRMGEHRKLHGKGVSIKKKK